MTIGVTIIVSDRWEELERCLTFATGFYDYLSICIVNYPNIDEEKIKKIRKIAQNYNAIINEYSPREDWEHPFIDNFSAPRNIATNALPKCDWVFVLDTDDELQDPLEAREKILALESPQVFAIRLTDSNNEASLYQLRGWSQGSGGKYKGRIHEQFVWDMDSVAFDYIKDIVIIHRVNKPKDHRDRNVIILEDVIKRDEGTAREQFLYAELLYMRSIEKRDDWEKTEIEAEKIFTKLLDEEELNLVSYKINCYLADLNISRTGREGGLLTKGTEYILEALRTSIYYPEPYFLMGKILYMANNYKYAIGWLEHGINMPEMITFWHSLNNFRKSLPHEQLALVYKKMGNRKKAFEHHSIARALDVRLEKNDKEFYTT